MDFDETDYIQQIKKLLNDLDNKDQRIFKIKFSNAFRKPLDIETRFLVNKYKVIKFSDLYNKRIDYATNSIQSKRYFYTNFIFNLAGLIPSIGTYISLITLVTDFSQYQVTQSDFRHLRKTLNFLPKPAKKYHKLRNLVLIPNIEQLSLEEKLYLSFVIRLIEEKYLSQTAILIIEPIDNVTDITIANKGIVYKFDLNNYTQILHDKKIYSLTHVSRVVLNSIGIDYIDKVNQILNGEKTEDSYEAVMTQIIREMIENSKPQNSDDLKRFITLCSFLFESFTINDISEAVNLEKNPLNCGLDDAMKTNIICKEKHIQKYLFLEEKIRQYFQDSSYIFEANLYTNIYNYLQKTYPKNYADIALLSGVLLSDENEILSNYLIAFYQEDMTMPGYKLNAIRSYIKKSNDFEIILRLHDAYSEEPQNLMNYREDCLKLLSHIDGSGLNNFAKAAAISYPARVLYEIHSDFAELEAVEETYLKYINKIVDFASVDTRIYKYVLDYISFTTAIENNSTITTVVQRLVTLLNTIEPAEVTSGQYVKFMRMGNAVYPSDPKQALMMTQKAFNSKQKPIEQALSGINYGVSLCLNARYREAVEILSNNDLRTDVINTISADNNLLLAQYFNGKFDAYKTLTGYTRLLKIIKKVAKSYFPV